MICWCFFCHERLWVIGEFGAFLAIPAMEKSNHLIFKGKIRLEPCWSYMWNLCRFFPPKNICIIKELIGWVFGEPQKAALFFKDLTKKPWCSPQRLPTIRVALMPCNVAFVALEVTCSIGQSGPQFSFRSGFRCIVPRRWSLKRRRFLPGFSCQKRKRFLDLGVCSVFLFNSKKAWLDSY